LLQPDPESRFFGEQRASPSGENIVSARHSVPAGHSE